MRIMKEEIFGPVVSIAKFSSEEEVIELANDTTYGLAAGIFTKDYERAVRVTSALKAGTTWVNLFNFVHWSMPFGGKWANPSRSAWRNADRFFHKATRNLG